MSDSFFEGADRYPARGWQRRAAQIAAQCSRRAEGSRPCPTCGGAGVFFDPPIDSDDVPRPRICHDCGSLKFGGIGGR
jgi:hypothetical protein